jgi:hypothetical protein
VSVSGDALVFPAPSTAPIRFSASRRIPCDHSLLLVRSQRSNPSATSSSVRVRHGSKPPTLFSFVSLATLSRKPFNRRASPSVQYLSRSQTAWYVDPPTVRPELQSSFTVAI